MSTDWNDPELDALLNELAPTDEARDALLEEHRQLEKDLLRLADPLPPVDFVQQVMKRVEQAPARAMSKGEIVSAASIVTVTVAAAMVALFTTGSGSSGLGLALAQLVISARDTLVAMGSALVAVWNTAALPLAVSLFVTVGLSLVALKRFGGPATAKVTS
jgi:anti-sigma factor RsiW